MNHLQLNTKHNNNKTFALYLPENEIHDLGLLFLNYEIVRNGYKAIFLGQSIQLDSLKYLAVNHPNISFVTYFTVKPEIEDIPDYFNEYNRLFGNEEHILYVLGAKTKHIDESKIPDNVRIMMSIREFVNIIKRPALNYA